MVIIEHVNNLDCAETSLKDVEMKDLNISLKTITQAELVIIINNDNEFKILKGRRFSGSIYPMSMFLDIITRNLIDKSTTSFVDCIRKLSKFVNREDCATLSTFFQKLAFGS